MSTTDPLRRNEGSSSSALPARLRPSLSRSHSLVVSSRSRKDLVEAQAAAPRQPITFALPSAAARLHPPSPPGTPARGRGPSLLKKIGRSLSQSRTQLVRKVSGKAAATGPRTASPARPTSPSLQVDAALEESTPPPPAAAVAPLAGATGLRRGFRSLQRSKSEGRKRAGVEKEEDRMEHLVRRTEANERAVKARVEKVLADKEGAPSESDVRSGLGSYFWSDSLGVCWDGREQVHPDLLSSQRQYDSNADFVPPRMVFTSTLSTFPPRPPLRRLSSNPSAPASPGLSPASQIIADYRNQHGMLTPINPSPADTTPASPTPRGVGGGYARSIASLASSSGGSDYENHDTGGRFSMGGNKRVSEDSSTSLESAGRPPVKTERPATTSLFGPGAQLPRSPKIPRFALVDEGPVKPLQAVENGSAAAGKEVQGRGAWETFRRRTADDESDSSSLEDDWRECE